MVRFLHKYCLHRVQFLQLENANVDIGEKYVAIKQAPQTCILFTYMSTAAKTSGFILHVIVPNTYITELNFFHIFSYIYSSF